MSILSHWIQKFSFCGFVFIVFVEINTRFRRYNRPISASFRSHPPGTHVGLIQSFRLMVHASFTIKTMMRRYIYLRLITGTSRATNERKVTVQKNRVILGKIFRIRSNFHKICNCMCSKYTKICTCRKIPSVQYMYKSIKPYREFSRFPCWKRCCVNAHRQGSYVVHADLHVENMNMLYKFVISCCNSFYSATRLMIRDHSLTSGSDYVKLIWTRPKFPPERYQVTYMCTMKARFTRKYDMENYVTKNTQYLRSGTTSFRISDLRPRSNCTLTLLAVYNWVSIDSGITITGTTLDEATSKRTLV